jgi:hypothetical protein
MAEMRVSIRDLVALPPVSDEDLLEGAASATAPLDVELVQPTRVITEIGDFEITLDLREAKKPFNPKLHPRWPRGTPKAGQWMRVGDWFMSGGKRWQVTYAGRKVLEGTQAEGKKGPAITKVFDAVPEAVDGPGVAVPDLTPAPPKKLNRNNAPVVDPYVDSSTHDPKLKLPANSKITAEQWKKFGRIDQMHYIDLQARFGEWDEGTAENAMQSVWDEYDGHAQQMVADAYEGVKSSETGYYHSGAGKYINLANLTEGIELQKQGSGKEMVWQNYLDMKAAFADISDAAHWDLYNRVQAPDMALFHGGHRSVAEVASTHITGSEPIYAGFSQSYALTGAETWGNRILVTPTAIRHIGMSYYTPLPAGSGYVSSWEEQEVAVNERMALDERSVVYDSHNIPHQVKTWLGKSNIAPVSGDTVAELRNVLAGKGHIPIPEQEPQLTPVHKGGAQWEKLPAEIAAKAGEMAHSLPYKSEEGDKEGAQGTLGIMGLKAGDFIEGQQGTRYIIIEDAGDTANGLRYVKIDTGGSIVYEKGFHFSDSASNPFFRLNGHIDIPKKKKVGFKGLTPEAKHKLAPGQKKQVSTMDAGTMLKLNGEIFKITEPSSYGTATVESMDTGKEYTINVGYKGIPMVPKKGFKPPIGHVFEPDFAPEPGMLLFGPNGNVVQYARKQPSGDLHEVRDPSTGTTIVADLGLYTPVPVQPPTQAQKGDTFSWDGKKYTVTTVGKTGANKGVVSAKPTGGGKVRKFSPSSSLHIAGMPYHGTLFRPEEWQHGKKVKAKDIAVGTVVSRSDKTLRPMIALKRSEDGKKLTFADMDTGKIVTSTHLKSWTVLDNIVAKQKEAELTTGPGYKAAAPEAVMPKSTHPDGIVKLVDLDAGEQFFLNGSTYEVTKKGTHGKVVNEDGTLGPEKPFAITESMKAALPEMEVEKKTLQPGDMVSIFDLPVGAQFHLQDSDTTYFIAAPGKVKSVTGGSFGTGADIPAKGSGMYSDKPVVLVSLPADELKVGGMASVYDLPVGAHFQLKPDGEVSAYAVVSPGMVTNVKYLNDGLDAYPFPTPGSGSYADSPVKVVKLPDDAPTKMTFNALDVGDDFVDAGITYKKIADAGGAGYNALQLDPKSKTGANGSTFVGDEVVEKQVDTAEASVDVVKLKPSPSLGPSSFEPDKYMKAGVSEIAAMEEGQLFYSATGLPLQLKSKAPKGGATAKALHNGKLIKNMPLDKVYDLMVEKDAGIPFGDLTLHPDPQDPASDDPFKTDPEIGSTVHFTAPATLEKKTGIVVQGYDGMEDVAVHTPDQAEGAYYAIKHSQITKIEPPTGIPVGASVIYTDNDGISWEGVAGPEVSTAPNFINLTTKTTGEKLTVKKSQVTPLISKDGWESNKYEVPVGVMKPGMKFLYNGKVVTVKNEGGDKANWYKGDEGFGIAIPASYAPAAIKKPTSSEPKVSISELKIGDTFQNSIGTVMQKTGDDPPEAIVKSKKIDYGPTLGGYVNWSSENKDNAVYSLVTSAEEDPVPYDQLKPGDWVMLKSLKSGDQVSVGDQTYELVSLNPGKFPTVLPISSGGWKGGPTKATFSDSTPVLLHKKGLGDNIGDALASLGQKIDTGERLIEPPSAEAKITPYAHHKSGSAKHSKISSLAPGTVFIDKGKKVWKLKASGSTTVVTDGTSYFKVTDPDVWVKPSDQVPDGIPFFDNAPKWGGAGSEFVKKQIDFIENLGTPLSDLEKGDYFMENGQVYRITDDSDDYTAQNVDTFANEFFDSGFEPTHIPPPGKHGPGNTPVLPMNIPIPGAYKTTGAGTSVYVITGFDPNKENPSGGTGMYSIVADSGFAGNSKSGWLDPNMEVIPVPLADVDWYDPEEPKWHPNKELAINLPDGSVMTNTLGTPVVKHGTSYVLPTGESVGLVASWVPQDVAWDKDKSIKPFVSDLTDDEAIEKVRKQFPMRSYVTLNSTGDIAKVIGYDMIGPAEDHPGARLQVFDHIGKMGGVVYSAPGDMEPAPTPVWAWPPGWIGDGAPQTWINMDYDEEFVMDEKVYRKSGNMTATNVETGVTVEMNNLPADAKYPVVTSQANAEEMEDEYLNPDEGMPSTYAFNVFQPNPDTGEQQEGTVPVHSLENGEVFYDSTSQEFTKLYDGPVQGAVTVEDEQGGELQLDVTTYVKPLIKQPEPEPEVVPSTQLTPFKHHKSGHNTFHRLKNLKVGSVVEDKAKKKFLIVQKFLSTITLEPETTEGGIAGQFTANPDAFVKVIKEPVEEARWRYTTGGRVMLLA